MMTIEQPRCKKCGEPLNLCEGDVIQIWQECLDSLIVTCEKCGADNEVEIKEVSVKLESV